MWCAVPAQPALPPRTSWPGKATKQLLSRPMTRLEASRARYATKTSLRYWRPSLLHQDSRAASALQDIHGNGTGHSVYPDSRRVGGTADPRPLIGMCDPLRYVAQQTLARYQDPHSRFQVPAARPRADVGVVPGSHCRLRRRALAAPTTEESHKQPRAEPLDKGAREPLDSRSRSAAIAVILQGAMAIL